MTESEIITIPAGVIMPKDLLMWLRKRRDEAEQGWHDAEDNDDLELAGMLHERAWTYGEVIQHIQFG